MRGGSFPVSLSVSCIGWFIPIWSVKALLRIDERMREHRGKIWIRRVTGY
jgi:hypothetical protein